MTPQTMIEALDTALYIAGESVRLLRMNPPPASGVLKAVTCQAMMRGFDPTEVEPGSGISQQDQRVTLSPTDIIAGNWPGSGSPVPRAGDRIVSSRGTLTIQSAAGLYAQNTLVRIEAIARGA